MNSVQLVGRVANDPEIVELGDHKYVNLLLAVETRSRENAYFVQCRAWDERAEMIYEYCHKGDLEAISGYIDGHFYKSNDTNRYSLTIIIERIEFLTPRKKD